MLVHQHGRGGSRLLHPRGDAKRGALADCARGPVLRRLTWPRIVAGGVGPRFAARTFASFHGRRCGSSALNLVWAAALYLNRLRHRDSTKSITFASRLTPSSRSISCTPVGLVTFTSVR